MGITHNNPDPLNIQTGSHKIKKRILDDGSTANSYSAQQEPQNKQPKNGQSASPPPDTSPEPPNDSGMAIDSTVIPPASLPIVKTVKSKDPSAYNHQQMMEFRPAVNCGADEETFKSSKFLTFSFLVISEQWYNKKGDLIKCRLKCAFCVAKNLTHKGGDWGKQSHGQSTGIYTNHFLEVHRKDWVKAEKANSDEGGAKPKNQEEMGQTMLDVQVSNTSCIGYNNLWLLIAFQCQ